MIQHRNIWPNSVNSVLTIDCDPRRIRTTLYHEHTNICLTVHFLLRDLLHGTLYRPNFVAHPLTARFVAVLKHFYCLSFIPSDIVFYSMHFSLAYFIARRPWTSDGGAIANDWLIDWNVVYHTVSYHIHWLKITDCFEYKPWIQAMNT